MKHALTLKWLIALFFFFGTPSAFAQTAKDVFTNSETPILFLGVDFTKSKAIDELTISEFDLRDKYYPGINEIAVDPKKIDLKGAFHKSYIDHDLGIVIARNSKINAEDIKSTNTADFHKMQASDIETMVKGYDFGDKKGVGLIFFAEAISKSEKAAAVWVTLVDMKTKKVLMTERMQGKIGGFGLKANFIDALKNIVTDIEKKKYNEWKAKYAN
jgi:hypothetical protein